jgi:hypothetical protein
MRITPQSVLLSLAIVNAVWVLGAREALGEPAPQTPSPAVFQTASTEAGAKERTIEQSWSRDQEHPPLLLPYKRTYLVYQWTEGDDRSIEVQYSFRYPFVDCLVGERGNEDDSKAWYKCNRDSFFQWHFDLSYTGEFDFYVGSRGSSPVINRTSNPGVRAHGIFNRRDSFRIDLDVALEHRSNGQDRDAEERDPNTGEYVAAQMYQALSSPDSRTSEAARTYFDRISRSSDFVRVSSALDTRALFGRQRVRGEISGKFYVIPSDHEAKVTWGDHANDPSTHFSQYDLVEVSGAYRLGFSEGSFFEFVEAAVDYKLGRGLFGTDSVDVSMLFPYVARKYVWVIPLFIQAHLGPMERLSDHTRSVFSFAAGVDLSL